MRRFRDIQNGASFCEQKMRRFREFEIFHFLRKRRMSYGANSRMSNFRHAPISLPKTAHVALGAKTAHLFSKNARENGASFFFRFFKGKTLGSFLNLAKTAHLFCSNIDRKRRIFF